jgi:hypothetical protein
MTPKIDGKYVSKYFFPAFNLDILSPGSSKIPSENPSDSDDDVQIT